MKQSNKNQLKANVKKPIIFRIRKTKITQSLILINLLFFLGEVSLGGSENLETLYHLGALVPRIVWQGEFWRLVTANFLHYGWLHLLVNMIGLYFLGGLVESNTSIYYYLIVYFSSGIGAMFTFSYVALKTNNLDYILVGASASIMGLFGSVLALLLRHFLQARSQISTRRLQFMLLAIVFQFTLDLLIPEISFLSHLFGFIIGFFMTLILLRFFP